MSHSRLRLLGLCFVVLGMMAFSANAAQAVPQWLILHSNGTPLDTAVLNAVVIAQLENSDGNFLTKILGIKVKILCTALQLVGVKLQGEGKTAAGGKVQFTGCKTFLAEKESTACVPHSTGTASGTVTTNGLKSVIVSHTLGGTTYGLILIEPETGTAFVTLILGAEGGGNECPIGEKVTVNGKLYLGDCQSAFTTHRVQHLYEEAALSELWTLNKTAEHLETSLDGSTLFYLTGAHTGLSWGPMLP